jgi:hypothetical protein
VGYGLSVAPQNRWEDENGAGHTSRSSGLLRLEASWARVSQSSLKIERGMAQMVHVASSWRSQGDEAEDGWVNVMSCIRVFYPNFTVFIILGHKCTLVISFPVNRTPMVGGETSIHPSLSHPPGFRTSFSYVWVCFMS